MRFIEVPALITEDIEDPNIVDITETETVTASINGTTLTIDGDSKVSGEVTITLTGDVTVNAVTVSNIKQPSIHKIIIKTNGTGNFTYVPNTGVTASSVSTTTKTGSDLDILLITTSGGDTYLDLDIADYVSPAANFSNALTGFNITDLTSAYGATAKLYKPGETSPLTTVTSAATESGVNFGYTETDPGDVIYKLEVTDDLGRKSTYNLPRKWINYAMETTSTPGFQKFALAGNEYTSTVTVPNLTSSSKARIHKTTDHGYMGIKFKIQGRNSTDDAWTDIANADENDDVLAFGEYLYHRVWVKPTAKATTTVSSSNVVTLSLTDFTEENVTTSFTGADPYDINETTNVYVFEETTKVGTVPFTVTLGTETYTNAVTATTEEIGTVPNTDFSTSNAIFTYGTSGGNQAAMIFGSDDANYLCVYNPADGEQMFVYKGDPSTGSYALYGGTNGDGIYRHADYVADATPLEGSAMSWDGKYMLLKKYYRGDLTIFKNNESTSTYDQLIANHTATEATTASWGASAFIPNSYDFIMTRHAYANYGFRVVYFENSGDTWTEKWTWENPNSGGLTHSNSDTKWGRFGFQFSKDKKYAALTSYANPTSVAVLKVDLENTTTQNKFEKIWEEGITQGYACAMSPDGKYIIAGNQKIFKNNDAGDWTTKTEVQSEFTNNTIFTDYCIFLGDKYVAGGNTSSKHLFEFYPKKEVTLAFANPTLRLTTSNVTISSAKLYRDDVLFHTYGTESNVVLRSDQTGTYQAIVNDVYYSNRITPDFTTTRSVSAPQLEFDGYNKLHLSNITPTSTTLGVPDGTTRDLTTQSNVYIYETGTYTANVQTSDTFAYLSNVVTSQPSQNPTDVGPTLTFDGFNRLSLSNITQTSSTLEYGSNTYDTNTASNVYVTYAGEYVLEAKDANTFVTSNVYVGAVDTIPGFTAAFHHGAFSASDYSSAYSTVAEAATAGFVYSDTAAGTYSWGTLAHVKERENPDFTANSTLHTDYSSTYGWTTNSDWEVSAKDEFNTTYPVWKAFNKNDGGDAWLSGSAPSTSSPQWLKIKYPSQQVIKSYVIKCRDNSSPRFPTAWKLQGSNNDSDWTDIGTEQTVSLWSIASEKSFDVSSNTTAYQYYRLRITGSRESASLSNSDYVAIGEWFLNTVNGENTTNHDQYTRYTYTPPASTITANVLRVAGGGGGGSTRGAGGGAGGLLYSENVSLSGAKSISVANGGRGCKIGGSGNQSSIQQGFDTTFSGLTTSVGGGRGAFSDPGRAGSGGSGGGGGPAFPTAGTGISGQGYAGGNSNAGDNFNGGGGGGAGGVGATGPGVGGVGLDYSSVFGTTYGVSGWFAGGGGGGQQSGGLAGGQGGGGTYGTNSGHGVKHTGGGGGGSGTSGAAGSGGSGIVIIKKLGAANPPALNFDGYNKLSIDNVKNIQWNGGSTNTVTLSGSGAAWGGNTYEYKSSDSFNTSLLKRFWRNGNTDLSETIYLSYDASTGVQTIEVEGTNMGGNPTTVNSSTSSSATYIEGDTITLYYNGTSLIGQFVVPASMTWSAISITTTIKKDGAAFATTTSNTVYIRDEGTYTAEVKGSDAYAIELSKEVSAINNAPDWRETQFQILYSENPNQNDYFGIGVDIDGDYACIGSPYDDTNDGNKGAVYVFHKSNGVWTYQDILQPDSTSENFAVSFTSLSIHGDTIAVGAQANDTGGTDFGAVYVFRRNGTSWSKEAKLQSTDVQTSDNFGSGVGIYGDYIVAGAYAEDSGGSRAGSAYIFKRTDTTWQQTDKIQSGDQSIDDKFGIDCKIYGDYVIVSAPEEDIAGSEYGAAYIFKKNADETWSKTETLLASDGAYLDRIGYSVGIYDEYAIVGAQLKDNGGTNRGGAYIFKKNADESWSEQAILTSDDPIDNYSFGTSVYIKGNYAIVGEPGVDANTGGFMYVFERSGSTWTQIKKFQVTNGQDANFGYSVAISGDTILSGAPYDDVKSGNAGACYIFNKTPPGPHVTYDNYNKITLNQLNYEDTTEVTYYSNTYNLGTAKTMYVKDAGEYVFKISGTDKYVESNVHVSSVDLAGAPTKPIDFDGFNKLTLIDAGSNVSANVTYFSNTYELGSANVLYINGAGTYNLEMSGSNVFALSSNVVGTVSQHLTDVVPSLTFDNYNKLTLENFTTTESDTRTATLTDPNGDTYSLGQTQNDIYIKDQGDYFLEVTNSDQSAVVTKSVGTISEPPDPTSGWTKVIQMGVKHDITSDVYSNGVTGTKSNWLNGVGTYNTASDDNYVLTWDRTSVKKFLWRGRDGAWEILFSNDVLDNFTSYWSSDRHYLPVISGKGTVNLDVAGSVDVSTITHMEVYGYGHSSANYPQMYFTTNGHHSGRVGNFSWMESSYSWNRDNLWGTNHQGFEVLVSTSDTAGHLIDPVLSPSLNFDGYNKLSIENITPISTTLKYGSNTYEIGTASNIYIEHEGTYKMATGDATTFALVSKVVSGDITPDLSLSETSIAKQFIYDTGGYTDAMFSEGSETQCIRLSSDGLAMALGDGNYNSNDGRLYYYERSSISDTFTKTHTFDAVSSGLEFGASVDMNAAKTRIAISGSDADTNAANAGRVYIYDRASTSASWPSSPTATITPPASTIKRFGHTVNMSDDGLTMITSGDGNSSTANESGVYVYEYARTAPSASTITFSSGAFNNNNSYYEKGPTTATTVLYNRRTSSSVFTGYGLLLEYQSDGTTKAYCNSPSTENLTPDQLSIDGGPFSDSVILISGKVLEGQYYSGVTAFKFTVNSTHLFSQGPEWSKTFQVTQGISRFGFKVAMNKTGTRFIAGGTGTAYYVYHKESGTWSSTVQLTGETGYHCGMSPDGNTVAVGIVQYSSNLGRVAVYKYSGGSWGSVVNIDTTVGTGTYQIGNTPVFNNDGTLLVTGCSAYNSYMGCFEMWKYESGSWVFKKQFLNPTVKTGHGNDTGEFFGGYLSMDYAGTSVIVSNPGNDVAGEDYGRVVLYGAVSPPSLTYDNSNKLSIENLTPTSTTLTDPNGSSFDIGTATDVYIRDSGKYSIASKDVNTFVLTSNTVTGTPTGTTYVYDSNTFTTPSQTYDNTKTVTVSNVPSTLTDVVGKIYKGSTAYTIHATEPTSNVIIKNTGSYVSVFTTATQAFLTNAIDVATQPKTTSEDTTIEDAAPIVTVTTTTVQDQEPETFSYTGAIQTYTVPDGVTSIKVKCWGAAGGGRNGGAGGYAGGTVSVTPGETIQVVVGQGGRIGGNLGSGGGFTGILSVWNTSDIAATHAGSIIIAGAGGGGGQTDNNPAGNGGGETGGVGQNDNSGARPGTQTAAGSAESDTSAASNPSGGSYFRGGNSAGNIFESGTPWPAGVWGGNYQRSKSSGGSQGGGGGGGYYGAGGAGNRNSVNSRGAAGGSGYIGGDGTREVTNGENLATSLTQKSSLPPKTDDEHYVSGAGTPASTDTNGGDGLVVIIPTKEVTTTTTTGGLAGSTAVPDETITDTPSAVLDVAAITTEDPILDLDFTTTLPRNLKRYNTITNSSIGARFNRTESKKKRIEKSINTDTFSIELTANNASSPTTLTVTVANSKFVINGDETPTLGFIRGKTYTFDQSDESNSGHPLVLATSEDGVTQYTTGWTTTPSSPDYVPGVSGAQGTFIVPYDVPDTIYYKCTIHPNMGGEINTTFGNVFSLGDFTLAANTHVSGEYTLATNFDGTTSNLYVNSDLITQTTPTIVPGVKEFILGKEFDGYVKNFTFWNYAKSFLITFRKVVFHYGSFDTVYGDADVNAAAAAGHVFDNTPEGTYPWGSLDSLPSTASNQTTYIWTPPGTLTVDILMVAGGGGGGSRFGGGGGGGGLLHLTNQSLSGQNTVVVGNGGVGGITNVRVIEQSPTNGKNSSFNNNIVYGGGSGGAETYTASNGGSGGGGSYPSNYQTGGTGVSGQGFQGGNGSSSTTRNNGGGGGAGGSGYGGGNVRGDGGIGLQFDISGISTYYGGGGGASDCRADSAGLNSGGFGYGGLGGGGTGGGTQGSGTGTSRSGTGDDGQKHTGGGGGGGAYTYVNNVDRAYPGGAGGSGIVIVQSTS
jgi:hypothetical protein